MLFAVGAGDLATFATAAFMLAAVTVVASYLPAHRGTACDPLALSVLVSITDSADQYHAAKGVVVLGLV